MISSYSLGRPGEVMAPATPKDARAVQLGEWLQTMRKRRGLSRPEAVSEMMKHDPRATISSDYLAKIEYGNRNLASASMEVREAIRQALNISREDWSIETGLLVPSSGPWVRADTRPHAQDGAVPLLVKNKIVLPVYDMAAASPSGIGVHAIPVKNIEVDPQFVKSTTRAYLVLGDSMDNGTRDSIADGDVVLVNEGDCDLKDGKAFIVKVPGNGVLVKRVRTYPDGETYLTSDNPNYRPIRPDEAQIIGRVYRHIPAERDM